MLRRLARTLAAWDDLGETAIDAILAEPTVEILECTRVRRLSADDIAKRIEAALVVATDYLDDRQRAPLTLERARVRHGKSPRPAIVELCALLLTPEVKQMPIACGAAWDRDKFTAFRARAAELVGQLVREQDDDE